MTVPEQMRYGLSQHKLISKEICLNAFCKMPVSASFLTLTCWGRRNAIYKLNSNTWTQSHHSSCGVLRAGSRAEGRTLHGEAWDSRGLEETAEKERTCATFCDDLGCCWTSHLIRDTLPLFSPIQKDYGEGFLFFSPIHLSQNGLVRSLMPGIANPFLCKAPFLSCVWNKEEKTWKGGCSTENLPRSQMESHSPGHVWD